MSSRGSQWKDLRLATVSSAKFRQVEEIFSFVLFQYTQEQMQHLLELAGFISLRAKYSREV